jgi:hypothetical protein
MTQRPLSLQHASTTEPVAQPIHFNLEDGGSIFLQNVLIRLQNRMMPECRRPESQFGKEF